MSVYQTFAERGFVAQCTDEKALSQLFDTEQVLAYIGFDPTATSLHVGSLIPILSLVHLQRAGHRPIAVVGGGTGLVGDPSGKTEMRNLLTLEQLAENAAAIKVQLSRFLDFGPDQAIMVNNADWLVPLNYIEFLRDVGRHFSMNKMLAAESVKLRLASESGLSFLEFNYQLLQAYDFMHLCKDQGCRLQMGGNDQWGNIVAGVDLTRRMLGKTIYGLTFPLITTSTGQKMGKTHAGTVWLDPERTSPYDFYQYWINTTDDDVVRFLKLFTFLSIERIDELARLEGADIREAKKALAYEATKIVHGEDEAKKAQMSSMNDFGTTGISPSKKDIDEALQEIGEEIGSLTVPGKEPILDVPFGTTATTTVNTEFISLWEGKPIFKLLSDAGVTKSSSEARRLIQQGGAYLGKDRNARIENFDEQINLENADDDGAVWIWAGKKKPYRFEVFDVYTSEEKQNHCLFVKMGVHPDEVVPPELLTSFGNYTRWDKGSRQGISLVKINKDPLFKALEKDGYYFWPEN